MNNEIGQRRHNGAIRAYSIGNLASKVNVVVVSNGDNEEIVEELWMWLSSTSR